MFIIPSASGTWPMFIIPSAFGLRCSSFWLQSGYTHSWQSLLASLVQNSAKTIQEGRAMSSNSLHFWIIRWSNYSGNKRHLTQTDWVLLPCDSARNACLFASVEYCLKYSCDSARNACLLASVEYCLKYSCDSARNACLFAGVEYCLKYSCDSARNACLFAGVEYCLKYSHFSPLVLIPRLGNRDIDAAQCVQRIARFTGQTAHREGVSSVACWLPRRRSYRTRLEAQTIEWVHDLEMNAAHPSNRNVAMTTHHHPWLQPCNDIQLSSQRQFEINIFITSQKNLSKNEELFGSDELFLQKF